ncbi:hypothetical protein R0381_002771 [Jeongeupia wiesaeckerbachi]|uniref:hypothetical protein n=1 Tax=Jeongeupia wiesaeckerbachi TaxID=3051218 RepID=UPI003D801479
MLRTLFPILATLVLVLAGLVHGPIAQLPNYHAFADQARHFGIPHFADVVSNFGFLLVGLWGFVRIAPYREEVALAHGWPGYRLFLSGLLLTSIGSTFYHLAPDDARLVWDRLPIALVCAGLLAGVWGDTHQRDGRVLTLVLAGLAVASVAWWWFTGLTGIGDLRPYLLLQALPIVLVPIWQWGGNRRDRVYFGLALLLYGVAKLAELNDHLIGSVLCLTGHTLKHLLATLAAASIVAGLELRIAHAVAFVPEQR